jgi:hypothetical protein
MQLHYFGLRLGGPCCQFNLSCTANRWYQEVQCSRADAISVLILGLIHVHVLLFQPNLCWHTSCSG